MYWKNYSRQLLNAHGFNDVRQREMHRGEPLVLGLHEELHNLYTSPNIIRVIKLRRWVGHVAQMGALRNA
jgi:hypothetical protein